MVMRLARAGTRSVMEILRAPEFRRFLIVGVFNTFLGYGLYLLLDWWLPYALAYLIGYSVGVVAQFFLHSRYVYRQQRPRGHLLAYPLLQVLIAGFGTLVLWQIVEATGWSSGFAGLLAIGAQTPLAFVCTRWWFANADAPRVAVRIACAVVLLAALLVLAVYLFNSR